MNNEEKDTYRTSITVNTAKDNEAFWQEFYALNTSLKREPSSFCQFVLDKFITIDSNHIKSLVDIGCGNGRDTFYFAKHGEGRLSVVGVDACAVAIESNTRLMDQHKYDLCSFSQMNINNLEAFSSRFKNYDFIYARFFLHSITRADQDLFMTFLGDELKPHALVLLEFRTDKDRMWREDNRSRVKLSQDEAISSDAQGHYRRYINFEVFCRQLVELKFELVFAEERSGLSIRGEDDPCLGRIVARKMHINEY